MKKQILFISLLIVFQAVLSSDLDEYIIEFHNLSEPITYLPVEVDFNDENIDPYLEGSDFKLMADLKNANTFLREKNLNIIVKPVNVDEVVHKNESYITRSYKPIYNDEVLDDEKSKDLFLNTLKKIIKARYREFQREKAANSTIISR